MKIPFHKMHGAGNDFIVVDDRARTFPVADAAFIRRLCARRTGIGADGILLIQPSEAADVRMRFINPDGGEVSMCGNGARCFAKRAHALGAAPAAMQIETGAGIVSAEVMADRVQLHLTAPSEPQLDLDLGAGRTVDVVDTGVPHAVVWVEDPQAVEVEQDGRLIREHPHFQPDGINADFATVEPDGSLSMRTYERGVEAETMACGTGAAAVAVAGAARGRIKMPVTVHCAGGFDLILDSVQGALLLTGGAVDVFSGEVEYGNRI